MATRTRIDTYVFGLDVRMVTLDCATCGCIFALTASFDAERREDGARFYCPNGHICVYRKSDVDKAKEEAQAAKREAERLRKSLERADRWLSDEQSRRRTVENSLRATKGVVTKLRKRAEAGLCPYCSRHFSELERHIHSKHAHEVEKTREEQP